MQVRLGNKRCTGSYLCIALISKPRELRFCVCTTFCLPRAGFLSANNSRWPWSRYCSASKRLSTSVMQSILHGACAIMPLEARQLVPPWHCTVLHMQQGRLMQRPTWLALLMRASAKAHNVLASETVARQSARSQRSDVRIIDAVLASNAHEQGCEIRGTNDLCCGCTTFSLREL